MDAQADHPQEHPPKQISESSDGSNGAIRPREEQFMELHVVTACARIFCRQFQGGEIYLIYVCLNALLYHFRKDLGEMEDAKNQSQEDVISLCVHTVLHKIVH